ncbi:hypothetical protein EPN96_06625 [bacterium]|nr:MAG: hypothetical protein EPN96_06625 [bacterium]
MTLEKGLFATDLAGRVLTDLSDPKQRRWSTDQITGFFNEGMRELAREGILRRTDLHVTAAGKALYETFAECALILRVEHEGRELPAKTAEEALRLLGPSWRARTGIPRCYVPGKGGILLAPAPAQDGEPLLFEGAPAIEEAEGGKISGDGYTGALRDGSVEHFLPGDGFCLNETTAKGVLRIEYGFYPRPSESGDSIPSRYADGLAAYALFRCLTLSGVEEEAERGAFAFARWRDLKERLKNEGSAEFLSSQKLFSPVEAL